MSVLPRRPLLLSALLAGARPALAQSWPTRPVRMLCGFVVTRANDPLQRRIAQYLTETLGQTFLIETRAGGGGNIAMDALAKSAPDGHTLLFGPIGPVITNPIMMGARLPYNAETDFAPIMRVSELPFTVAVHHSVPSDPAGFIAWLRENPEMLFSSPGVGSTGHLLGAQLSSLLGLRLQHVASRSTFNQADLMTGRLKMAWLVSSQLPPLLADGRVRAVMSTGTAREVLQPDVPTFAEAGFPQMTYNSWWALFGPRGLPADIEARLRGLISAFQKLPEIEAWMRSVGLAPVPGDAEPGAFARFLDTERERWARVIRENGINAS